MDYLLRKLLRKVYTLSAVKNKTIWAVKGYQEEN